MAVRVGLEALMTLEEAIEQRNRAVEAATHAHEALGHMATWEAKTAQASIATAHWTAAIFYDRIAESMRK